MEIEIEALWSTHTYHVTFHGERIHTVLTSDPFVVDNYLNQISYNHRDRVDNLIVGLDVEWCPSHNDDDNVQNPVAILQLCVDHTCIIFQFSHARICRPDSLVRFLRNPNFKFVGVGIRGHVRKLSVDYNLEVENAVDLRDLAVDWLHWYRLAALAEPVGLNDLSMAVLGVEVEKPQCVASSDWSLRRLSYDQVKYACVDAFASFEIARRLIHENH